MKKLILFFSFLTMVYANQKEADLYMEEIQLVFGDERCEKIISNYVANECHYNDFRNGEKYKSSNRAFQFGDIHERVCLKLLKKRIECVNNALEGKLNVNK